LHLLPADLLGDFSSSSIGSNNSNGSDKQKSLGGSGGSQSVGVVGAGRRALRQTESLSLSHTANSSSNTNSGNNNTVQPVKSELRKTMSWAAAGGQAAPASAIAAESAQSGGECVFSLFSVSSASDPLKSVREHLIDGKKMSMSNLEEAIKALDLGSNEQPFTSTRKF